MKNCPYCSAQLQEGAQFCLYCMRELTVKELTEKNQPKKSLRFICVILVVILAAVIAGICIYSAVGKDENETDIQKDVVEETEPKKSETDISDAESSQETYETTQQTTEDNTEIGVIVTYDDFYKQAIAATELLDYNALWNPQDLIMTHNKDGEWISYSTDINIPDADLKILFYNGGEEILTVISDVTEEYFFDAVCLYECIFGGIINYTFKNYQQMMSDTDMYPMELREEDVPSLLEEIGFPDVWADRVDEGTDSVIEYRWSLIDENIYLLYELRTRTYDGVTYYDIFMYNYVESLSSENH